MNPAITRTQKTEQEYDRVADLLLRRYETDTGRLWRSDPVAACQYWGERRIHYTKATWRLYRAALTHWMRRYGPVEATDLLHTYGTEACPRRSSATSSTKAKTLRTSTLTTLLDELLNRRASRYAVLLSLWLVAGRLTGLRPSEWRDTRIEGDILVVTNAKATNGRGTGKERRVPMEEFSSADREVVRTLVDRLSGHEDFELVYTQCRRLLARVARRLWPNRDRQPTLYSARHQYSADGKASGWPLELLADRMGHNSTDTAQAHYGKRRQGEADPELRASAVLAVTNEKS